MTATLDIRIEGMTCAHCARTVEKSLLDVPGVEAASADFASGNVRLTLAGEPPSFESMEPCVSRAGYRLLRPEVAAKTDAADTARRDARGHLAMLLLGVVLTLPVMLIDWLHLHGAAWDWTSVGLAVVLQATAGLTFYRGAIANLRTRTLGMDVLVSIGMAAGLVYGVLITALDWPLPEGLSKHVFFEAATLLVVFLRLGKFVEAKARAGALGALRSLLQLAPETARVRRGGSVVEVPAKDVAVGDVCLVAAGGRIPVDGEVVNGEGDVDESMLTGESVPEPRKPGDAVRAGTISVAGALEVRAMAVGGATALAHIVRLVEEAQRTKAPIQRLADRISNWFVPVVVAIAVAAAIGWLLAGAAPARAITHAIAVLVIACPCALGIAVPAAVMIGSGAALRRGILVKNGAALEQIARTKIFAFDKTGTLTEGKPHVGRMEVVDGISEPEIRAAMTAVGMASRHPYAQAARRAIQDSRFKIQDGTAIQDSRFEIQDAQAGPAVILNLESSILNSPVRGFESAGKGVVVIAGETTYLFGNDKLMAEQNVKIPHGLASRAEDIRAAGESVSFLAEGERVLAAIGFVDRIRADAAHALDDLRRAGARVVLISGDHEAAVKRVAGQLGITEFHAAVTPEGKLELIDALKQQGITAMVGDGINDAPALARADVGVAIGSGSDVARETGDMVLMSGHLADLPRAVDLGRRSLRAIRQNLFFSLAYNAVGIPLAAGALVWAGIFLPPSFAALSMVFSDLSVAINSARLAAELRRVRT